MSIVLLDLGKPLIRTWWNGDGSRSGYPRKAMAIGWDPDSSIGFEASVVFLGGVSIAVRIELVEEVDMVSKRHVQGWFRKWIRASSHQKWAAPTGMHEDVAWSLTISISTYRRETWSSAAFSILYSAMQINWWPRITVLLSVPWRIMILWFHPLHVFSSSCIGLHACVAVIFRSNMSR